jgi:hypothetical protein
MKANGRTNWGAAKTDAAFQRCDHNERLRQRGLESKARRQLNGRLNFLWWGFCGVSTLNQKRSKLLI